MARLFILGLVSMLLIACSDTAIEEKEAVEDDVKEQVVETKTVEQYIEEFKDAVSYEALVAETEINVLNPVDVDGDSIPEMVLVVNEDILNGYVAVFKVENEDWVEMSREAYTSTTYIQLSFVDKLQYQDSPKEAFLVGVEEAGARNMYKGLNVFMYNETEKKIKQNIRFQIDPSQNESDLVTGNKLSFMNIEGKQITYEFQNGQFIDGEGKRFGTIIDDELAQLLGTTINDHYLTLYDTYEEAIDKISETPEQKQDSFGSNCSVYESFYICEDGVEGKIYSYYMTPLNEVTVEDLETYFGQPITISGWENLMDDRYTYSAEIFTPDSMYGMEFESDSPNAKLQLFSFTPKYE